MTKVKVTISLPTIVEANDYHEFGAAEYFFEQIGLKVKVEEVGFAGKYRAIVYKAKNAEYKKLKKALDKESQDWLDNG